jgi:2-C-methyl-D-erythritol 4-phosphate cytidylyltransferase/2-C-methyl-D-erythritol 4-phosphate cytidylyltransferase/2-C-methyl-D-erythritol 2,4-cyclodiphosphate synthase
MKNEETIAVVICAAGTSRRMGGVKKEYLALQQPDSGQSVITVLGSVVRAFSAISSVNEIVIAVLKDEEDAARAALPPDCLSASKPKLIFINGGDTRQASVYNALLALAENKPAYVLIHDGARPWISRQLIEKTIEEVQKHDAVIPVLPLTETPKEIEGGFITKHFKRAGINTAQTPQAFKFPEILYAHEKAVNEKEEFTDDAEIWGRFCGKVFVIPGDPEKRKITFQGDI